MDILSDRFSFPFCYFAWIYRFVCVSLCVGGGGGGGGEGSGASGGVYFSEIVLILKGPLAKSNHCVVTFVVY